MALEELTPDDRVIVDLERGIPITIGFSERQQWNNVQTLMQFITQHPEFTTIILPIINHDQKYGFGEIDFRRVDDRVKGTIHLFPEFNGQQVIRLPFAHLTEPFGAFTTNSGELALNYG